MGYDPVVFISSTEKDLKEHREQASRAARALGFSPRMMEYFPANGAQPSLAACREKVAEAEVVVVLVAHRYGWVPDDPSNPDAKSITWLECDYFRETTGKEVLAFLVDEEYGQWPLEHRENYRLVTEADKLPELLEEVRRNERNLEDFKQELSGGFRGKFTDAASVRSLVAEALAGWRERHPGKAPTKLPGDPDAYLEALEDDTRHIRIRALKSKRAEPYVFGIDDIYIPLTTSARKEELRDKAATPAEERQIAIERALSSRTIVIGEPGSGKSTFLRRVAFELCRTLRGTRPDGAAEFLDPKDRRFPILIRTADLAKMLGGPRQTGAPLADDAPDWIPYFLAKQSADHHWGLDAAFFRGKLDAGDCLVMVDGLDEAPSRALRERVSGLFEKAAHTFSGCDFLVSSRPQSYTGDSVLADFDQVRISDLKRPQMETFIAHFASALVLNEQESTEFQDGIHEALDRRVEIREMASNPVMLTALAVLQHNDQRLPEYRVDLYGSIIGWLAAAREGMEREGREGVAPRRAEECIRQMRKLALHMQDAPSGERLVQMNKRDAAEFFTEEFGGNVEANEELLERETQDAGIISSVGTDLKFWHLSFQEYLAALEIAGLSETQQHKTIVETGKMYNPEWRETMRLLGGVLLKQGESKVDGLFEAILKTSGSDRDLGRMVPCVALLSAMMRDLRAMKYTPGVEGYEEAVKAVMGIFETGESEAIDIKKRIEAAELLGRVGDPRLDEDNWVTIPAGKFRMGAQSKESSGDNYDPEADDDESPVREVELGEFRIGRFPVTVQEFGQFIDQGGYSVREYWMEGFEKFSEPDEWETQQGYPNRPVVGVSWYEAAAFCKWAGGRLPTEAEWERAARGPGGSRYPWGDEPPLDVDHANYSESEIGAATPVGLYPKGRTTEGLCDVLGNVWEWCQDWFSDYDSLEVVNPTGDARLPGRVVRGGSWINDPRVVRISYRDYVAPADRVADVGFRCARG